MYLFFENIRLRIRIQAKGHKAKEADGRFQLREDPEWYITDLDSRKAGIERSATLYPGENVVNFNL